MRAFFIRLIICAGGIAAAAWIVPGVTITGPGTLLMAALLLGLIRLLLGPKALGGLLILAASGRPHRVDKRIETCFNNGMPSNTRPPAAGPGSEPPDTEGMARLAASQLKRVRRIVDAEGVETGVAARVVVAKNLLGTGNVLV